MADGRWVAVAIFWLGLVVWAGPGYSEERVGVDPPGQREVGLGGKDYAYEGVRWTAYGEGVERYWVIEPRGEVAEPVPVVLFAHGLGMVNPDAYRGWIDHLVLQGNVVVYPRYHGGGVVDPKTFTGHVARGLGRALERLDGERHARVDKARLTMVGHSLGGTIIANLAARPEHYGLPRPLALMLMQPGDTKADKGVGALFPSLTEDHGTIAAGTLMLIVDVADDYFVSPKAGVRIYHSAGRVGAEDKARLLLRDDDHGWPALRAVHELAFSWGTATGRGRADAYDYACWRWFDALRAAAYGDESKRAYVLGDTAERRDIGRWSDGRPVRGPEVYRPE